MAEGDYTAAMRGSYSQQWQAEHPSGSMHPNLNAAGSIPGVGPNLRQGACYRCHQEGHWSQDCPMPPPTSGSAVPDPSVDIPPKPCPCGAGMCLVRTSNTQKNPGRKFYSCPNKDSGKCNFFQWCDAVQAPSPVVPSYQPQLPVEAEMKCPSCGQPCTLLTAKTEKNNGRRFFKCQRGCNFFKWCDEINSPSSGYKGSAYGSNSPASYGNPPAGHGNYGPADAIKAAQPPYLQQTPSPMHQRRHW